MPELTAFILAGGKSTRMGVDKVFLQLDGRTLLARALELARGLASDVRIVGDVPKFEKFGPVVEDIFQNCGPLGGIHAALRASATDLNLILAVDVPFVPAPFLSYMIEQAENCSSASAIAPRAAVGWNAPCVLDRVSFDVLPGETVCILGRSGVGKSVALQHIMGFLKPDSGRVIVAGEDIAGYTEEQMEGIRKKVTMVFQNGALFDSLTVLENVAFPLRESRGLNEEQIFQIVDGLLQMVGVQEMRDLLPSDLST